MFESSYFIWFICVLLKYVVSQKCSYINQFCFSSFIDGMCYFVKLYLLVNMQVFSKILVLSIVQGLNQHVPTSSWGC